MRYEIDQNGAICLAFALCKVIHTKIFGCLVRRQWYGPQTATECGRTSRQEQGRSQTGTSFTARCKRELRQNPLSTFGASAARCRNLGKQLCEGPSLAFTIRATEATDAYLEQNRTPTDGEVDD